MGSRLSIATVIGMVVASNAAAQPALPPTTPSGPVSAAESAREGTDLYNTGDFAGAVAPFQRAVELEPDSFEYRFALAQALRQSGSCGDAVPHYKQALAGAPVERQSEVSTAMAACPTAGITQQPSTPAPPPPPVEPQVVVQGGLTNTNAALLVGAGAGLAAGLCLFLAASADDDDAAAAASYEDHDRIATRADRLRIGALIGAGAGVALGVIAIYRIKLSKEGTELSFTPRKGGGALVLEKSW